MLWLASRLHIGMHGYSETIAIRISGAGLLGSTLSVSYIIEIRTLGCDGIPATGSYISLAGINIPNIDY